MRLTWPVCSRNQTLALAAGAPGVLGSGVGRADHGAQPALATIPGHQGAQDRLDVDGIGLFAPSATVDLQRARVDNRAFDASGQEPSMQPEAFVAGLVTRAHPCRRPARAADQRQQPIDIASLQLVPRRPLRAGPEHRGQPTRPAQLDRNIERRAPRTHHVRTIRFHDTPRLRGVHSEPSGAPNAPWDLF